MTAQLHICLPHGLAPRTIALESSCTIGRTPDNDLVIDDPLVSRHHALISLLSSQQYYVTDLGSANGTFLNGRPVVLPALIKSGDELRIGGAKLILDRPQSPGPLPPAESPEPAFNTQRNFSVQTVLLLVVDIRGFTRLSESIPAAKLAQFIGGWFQDVSRTIEKHGGTIEKFIGDAIKAYWLPDGEGVGPNFVRTPLIVAQELLKLAQVHHAKLTQEYPALSFGIGCGIHCGEATLGNVGNMGGRDFTATGDCVNVAFRIESLCKEKGRPILVSQAVKDQAGANFQFDDCGVCQLKGRTEPVHIFALRN